ncbi:MAG: GNAT family N-acetyltransferase [Desulfomonilaceae bacterium]
MNKQDLTIRRMNRGELDMACDWAAKEGWNPGIYDSECFYAQDPDGFFIGLLDDRPVAMVSAVAYGRTYGFMGFYIVEQDYRDTGYGLQMWEAGLDYLGNRCIGLDSVRPDLVSQKRPEFKPAYTNFRFKWLKDREFDIEHKVIPLSDISWATLMPYDYEVFTFERENFLRSWISVPGTLSFGVIRNDKLLGYGVIRQCREGFKVGPLFADDNAAARSLFNALTKDLDSGTAVFLDTPLVNTSALDLTHDYGMVEVFRTTRMYRGKQPLLPLHKWFGVTTFELG